MIRTKLLKLRWRWHCWRHNRDDLPYWLWFGIYVAPPHDLAEWR